MKSWKTSVAIIIVIASSLGTFKIFDKLNKIKVENYRNKIINDYAIKLEQCFDLENKNKRLIRESFKLIEYCIKEFGIE